MAFRADLRALLFVTLGAYPLYATTISVEGPGSSSVGGSVDDAVDVSSYTDLYAWQLDLTWNPAILSLISISEGSALSSAGPTFFIPGAIDNGVGSVTANADTLVGPVPGVTGSKGVLAYFDFKAIGLGMTTVSAGNITLLDSSLNTITANSESATVRIGTAGIASPEPGALRLTLLAASGWLAYLTIGAKMSREGRNPQAEPPAPPCISIILQGRSDRHTVLF